MLEIKKANMALDWAFRFLPPFADPVGCARLSNVDSSFARAMLQQRDPFGCQQKNLQKWNILRPYEQYRSQPNIWIEHDINGSVNFAHRHPQKSIRRPHPRWKRESFISVTTKWKLMSRALSEKWKTTVAVWRFYWMPWVKRPLKVFSSNTNNTEKRG